MEVRVASDKNTPIDYGNIPIKKLPPGKAFGADDLTRWSHRRATGRWGTGTAQTRALTVECRTCGGISEIIGIRVPQGRERRGKFDCRHCGKPAARIVKAKRLRAV